MQTNTTGTASTALLDRHAKLMKQAGKWASQTFFGTLLKQMRDSPFKSDLFDGGRGGQAFSAMFDQRLADHMAKGAGQKLVKALVRKIEGAAAYRRATQAAKKTPTHGQHEWSAK